MATYNWAFRPNVSNKYNFYIPDTPDDVRPDGFVYIALFGNDATGNGSRLKPYRSAAPVQDTYDIAIFGSGTYRDIYFINGGIIGDGNVVIDGYLLNWAVSPSFWTANFYNIRFRNINTFSNYFRGGYADCVFENCAALDNPGDNGRPSKNTVWVNDSLSMVPYNRHKIHQSVLNVNNNTTFVNVHISLFGEGVLGGAIDMIFSGCYIHVPIASALTTCIFHNCKFNFNGDVENPDQYLVYETIEELKEAHQLAFPNQAINFDKCIIGDPKFNNPIIGDFSLAFDSPAKNMSYFGTYIGARSIACPIKARAVETDGDFDFSTAQNLTIEDNSIILTNPEINASIETVVKANLPGRELAEAPIFGFNADRNGQYIDSIADLSNVLIGVGTDLEALTPYLVEDAAIVIDGAVIQPGERFTTDAVVTFTSDGGGVCREILEAPQRHTIMARFGNGGAIKSIGDALVAGNWYYPITGTINYNGIDYIGKAFKAIDTNSFTSPDGGTLIEAFTDEAYQHYQPGIAFSSNNIGNVRTGAILRGNGDPDYIRGVGFEFPINARFIQLKYTIRVKNLKP
ncbi:hypothetical protein DBR40_21560 [Pedobacter sp. KBW01]|uniref:hypothetical protein n=1 Tax=Pedobacter sp. KBW01 TaxID=2153364 RepID=UPI000F59DA99|nr:hypothetical protein [Pedobacter sp. KBW01]RQO66843.1 hypothetical protein DBR40_21560 [Pedobacter sp. KBW01]